MRLPARFARPVAAVTASLVLAVTVGLTARAASTPLTSVNVSYIISASAVPLFVGMQEGFYKDHGLDLHAQVVTGSPAAVAGVVSGQLQFATGTALTLMQAYSTGLPIEIVGPEVAIGKGTMCVLARTGTTLAQVHTVALNALGANTQLTDEMWMKQRGVDPTSIHYVAIPFASEVAALRNGTVDAVDVGQPFLGEALAAGGVSCLGDDTIEGGPYGAANAFWFTTQSFAQQNPQVVRDFAAALLKSNVYAATHPAAEAAADAQITGVPVSQASTTTYFGAPTAVNLGVLQRFASFGYQYGLISTQVTVKDMFWPGVKYTRI